MTFATDMIAVARDLTRDLGQSITVTRTTEGNFVPSTGDIAGEVTITYTAYGAPMNYRNTEIDGNSILENDLQVWIEVNSSGSIPAIGDTASISGQVYRVMNVTKYVAQGTTVLYRLQVRI